jgi:hypothetical protein
MNISRITLTFASLLIAYAASAQQSPNPQPQTQAQPTPCAPTTNPNPSGNNPHIKPPNAIQRALNKELGRIQDKTGVDVGGVAVEVAQDAKSRPAPCPTQANVVKNPQPAQLAVPKLPPDITTQLHCSPLTPSANGHPTTLTLPDAHDFGAPKPTDFLVDSVVPDLAAKTPCYLVKVDPKTNKSFVAQ